VTEQDFHDGNKGRVIDDYELVERLGAGAVGEVWKARDIKLDRVVALKLLPRSLCDSEEPRRRFIHEGRAAAAIPEHPGIASVYRAGEADGQLFLAMEYVDGHTLSDALKNGLPPVVLGTRIAIELADALEFAHEHGVLHRDIKCRNIMLKQDGTPVIVDFGLALRAATSRHTSAGNLVGTLAYMAPEVFLTGQWDRRSDVYSLGVVFYKLITGYYPFTGERPETLMYAILHSQPAPLVSYRPRIRSKLPQIVMRALEKDPDSRFQRAKDLAEALRSLRRARRLHMADRESDGRQEKASLASRPAPSLSPVARSLLILPLEYVSVGDGTKSASPAFVRGLAEALSAGLAKVEGLQVIPPSSLNGSGTKGRSLRHLAEEMGAGLVLRGTFQSSGTQFRVVYHVFSPHSPVPVASDSVTGVRDRLLDLPDELAASVRRVLKLGAATTNDAMRLLCLPQGIQHERYLQALGHLQNHHNEAEVDAAIRLLEGVLESGVETAAVHAALARAYLAKYRLCFDPPLRERAVESSDRALALDPRSADVLVTVGEIHCSAGRFAQAIEAFEVALQIGSTNADALLGLAEANAAAGQDADAVRICEQVTELRPRWWAGYNLLGKIHFARGRYEEAKQAWRRVIDLAPNSAQAHTNLGGYYYHLGDYDSAEKMYRESLRLRPTAGVYTNLGTLYYFQRRFDDAVEMFQKAASLREHDPLMWGNLGDALRWCGGRRAESASAYEHASGLMRARLETNPNCAKDWAYLAEWLAKVGRYPDAREAIERALHLPGDDVESYQAAVVVYHLLQDKEATERFVRELARYTHGLDRVAIDPELEDLRRSAVMQELSEGGMSNGAPSTDAGSESTVYFTLVTITPAGGKAPVPPGGECNKELCVDKETVHIVKTPTGKRASRVHWRHNDFDARTWLLVEFDEDLFLRRQFAVPPHEEGDSGAVRTNVEPNKKVRHAYKISVYSPRDESPSQEMRAEFEALFLQKDSDEARRSVKTYLETYFNFEGTIDPHIVIE
jgi:serine/threonine-protein kinase